jgi:hypothetical protein
MIEFSFNHIRSSPFLVCARRGGHLPIAETASEFGEIYKFLNGNDAKFQLFYFTEAVGRLSLIFVLKRFKTNDPMGLHLQRRR